MSRSHDQLIFAFNQVNELKHLRICLLGESGRKEANAVILVVWEDEYET